MRTVSGGETTVITGRVSAQGLRVRIKNAAGDWVDYSSYLSIDWQDRCEITIDVNQRVAECTLELARETEAGSLSPLMNTEIAAGRAIEVSGSRVAVGAGASDKLLFLGTIDAVSWENDPMTLVARDDAGALVDLWVREETEYGTADGQAIEAVMQEILDDWAPGFTLYTPVSPARPVNRYRQKKQSVQDALQALADLIGWVLEYRWDNGTGAFRLTFYEPDRAPSSTAWTFGPNDYYAVSRLSENSMDVRNMVTVRYTDSATGARRVYEVSDPASIARYGLQWAEFDEASDSPIDSATKAQALAEAALADLAWPVADQEVEVDLFWPLQLDDYLEFLANGKHYGANQEFGVTGVTHVWEEGKAVTKIRTRGTPVGHTEGWLKRETQPRPPEEVLRSSEILNFREISRTATAIKYGGTLGSDLILWAIHDYQEAQPYSTDKWPAEDRLPDSVRTEREIEITVAIPEQGYVGYLQVEGRRADGSLGDMERVNPFPSNVPGDYIAYAALTVNQTDGSVKIAAVAADRAQSLAYAFNVGAAASTASPTVAQAEAQGVGATGGGLFTGFTSDLEISLPAGTVGYGQVIKVLLVAYINENGTGPDGTAQDHDTPVGAQGERFKVTDPNQIAFEVILEQHFGDEAVSNRALALDAVARANIIDRVIDAQKIALLGLDQTGIFADLVIEGRVIVDNAIIARHIFVGDLSEISDNVGIVVHGELRNAAGTRYIDLDAVGSDPFINSEKFYITAAGNAYFAGELVAASGTFGEITGGHLHTVLNTAALRLSVVTGAPALPASNFIDFVAAGTEPFLKHAALTLLANGNATFSGTVAATSFTGASALFEGYIDVRDQSLASPGAKLEQNKLTLGGAIGTITLTVTNDGLGNANLDIASGALGKVRITSGIFAVMGVLQHDGSEVGFFGSTPITKPTVSGARDDPEGALASFLQQIENMGLMNDATTAS